jgi:hypothetical protein
MQDRHAAPPKPGATAAPSATLDTAGKMEAMSHKFWLSVSACVGVAASLACVAADERRESEGAPVAVEQRLATIEHVAPARDSVGTAPTRFEWTAAPGADRYAIGVWNDIDRLMWRQDDVHGTSVAFPEDIELEFGTYFWSVVALNGDRPVAESGRSAFVVK